MISSPRNDSIRQPFRSRTGRIAAPLVVVILIVGIAAAAIAATGGNKQRFNIPPGDAVTALKQFSAQSREQILFATESIAGIKTNAVKGEMTSREALDLMLAGTGLVVRQNEQTGAYSVRKASKAEKRPGSHVD